MFNKCTANCDSQECGVGVIVPLIRGTGRADPCTRHETTYESVACLGHLSSLRTEWRITVTDIIVHTGIVTLPSPPLLCCQSLIINLSLISSDSCLLMEGLTPPATCLSVSISVKPLNNAAQAVTAQKKNSPAINSYSTRSRSHQIVTLGQCLFASLYDAVGRAVIRIQLRNL